MITKLEFKKIVDRIGEAYKDPFTEAQFEEWYQHFSDENLQILNHAVTNMIEEYTYFPMVATLRTYVQKQKESEEQEPIPKFYVKTIEDMNRHERWMRFIWWIWEMCRKSKRTWEHPKTEEEVLKLRDYFETNFPNYKRPQIRKSKSNQIGDILGEILP